MLGALHFFGHRQRRNGLALRLTPESGEKLCANLLFQGIKGCTAVCVFEPRTLGSLVQASTIRPHRHSIDCY